MKLLDLWTRRSETVLGLRLLFFVACAFACLSSPYPPAEAQNRQVTMAVPVVTNEDVRQDEKLVDQDTHLKNTDANVSKLGDEVHKNSLDIAGIQGEERIFAGGLGLLSCISIVIQVRGQKKP